MILLNIIAFLLIALACWRGYADRALWLFYLDQLLGRAYRGKSFMRQLFGFGPVIIVWLLLCHWVNTHGWHGLAAGGILLAMTMALYAMRALEEKQKWEREECDTCE